MLSYRRDTRAACGLGRVGLADTQRRSASARDDQGKRRRDASPALRGQAFARAGRIRRSLRDEHSRTDRRSLRRLSRRPVLTTFNRQLLELVMSYAIIGTGTVGRTFG